MLALRCFRRRRAPRDPSQLEQALIADTLASFRRIAAIAHSSPDLNWKELNMALADILNAATAQITANTSAIGAAGDSSALQAQITELQGEIDAANTAAEGLNAAIEAQTAALSPPAPATGDATEEPAA